MPTLTAPAKAKANRAQLQPIFLAKMELFDNPTHPPAATLYLCDGSLAVAGYQALGEHWTPCVKSWGTLQAALGSASIKDVSGGPTTTELVLLNNKRIGGKRRFTDILKTSFNAGAGTYEFLLSKVTIYWLFAGLDSPDEIVVHEFYVDDFRDADTNTLRLRMSTIDAAIDRRQIFQTIDADTFPLSDPEARGRALVSGFGLMQNVPAWPIVSGGLTYVVTETKFSGSPVTVNVLSTKTFPQAGSFQAVFHDVTMTMRVINATQISLLNATANFTLPVGHPFLELRTGPQAYRYAVARNLVAPDLVGPLVHGAITNVRAGKIPQITGVTFDLNDNTFPGGSYAIINFSISPGQLKAISQRLFPVTQTSLMTFVRRSVNLPITIIAAPKDAAGATTTTMKADIRIPTDPIPGTIQTVTRSIRFKITGSPSKVTSWKITRSTGTAEMFKGTTSIPVGDVKTVAWTSAANFGPETITITVVCPAHTTGVFRIDIDSFEERIDSFVLTPDTSANSITDIVVGDVTCDVEGVHDDAAGTITGTPNALIQRPADCLKAILLCCYNGPRLSHIGATFATTRASQAAAGLVWALVLGAERFGDVRRRAAEQGRALLYVDAGKFEYSYIPDAPVADVTLDYLQDIWRDGPRAPLSRTPRTEVVTKLTSYAQIDPRKGSGVEAYLYSKTTLNVSFTLEELVGQLLLDWIQDQPTADAIHTFWSNRFARQRWQTELVTYPKNILGLPGIAHVAIKNHPLLANQGDTALIFQIQNRDYLMSDANPARIRLQMIEAGL